MLSKTEKERAYLYDLFIAPAWQNCFDDLFNENVGLPEEGRVLDVNCGTGGHSIEMAESLRGRGEVVALDTSGERLELARAKAQIKKLPEVTFFEIADPVSLDFEDNSFDLVVGDASMILSAYDIKEMVSEMVRVAKPGATVALKIASRGSFDEFFSIFWEAIHECHLDDASEELERLITERLTVSDAEAMAKRAGLKNAKSVTKKEEFFYDTARQFLTAPLIEDFFLDKWMEILPDQQTADRVYRAIERIIDRERHGQQFDFSIKATLIYGQK